jgi:hypothetical protein
MISKIFSFYEAFTSKLYDQRFYQYLILINHPKLDNYLFLLINKGNMIQYSNKCNCEIKKDKNLYFGKSFMNLDQIFAEINMNDNFVDKI